MPCFECDTRRFPFVFLRFDAERATNDDIRELIDGQRAIMHRRERFVIIVDASRPTYSTSQQRRMYGDWLREADALSRRYCAGVAVVIVNPLMRAALHGVLWFFTPPVQVEVFGTLQGAAVRAAEWMRREGLANADAPLRLVESASAPVA